MSANAKLMLLPGMDGSGQLFEELQKHLGDRIRWSPVSYPAIATDTYQTLVAQIGAGLGHGPYVLLGESFGGPIAVTLAAAHPDRIKGLILAGAFLTAPWPRWVVRAASRMNHRRLPRFAMNFALLRSLDAPELKSSITRIVAELPPDVMSQRLNEVADVDVRSHLEGVRCPILALHGSRDLLVSPRPIQAALDGKPGAAMRVMDGPHMLLQTRAKDCADIIVNFVKGL